MSGSWIDLGIDTEKTVEKISDIVYKAAVGLNITDPSNFATSFSSKVASSTLFQNVPDNEDDVLRTKALVSERETDLYDG